MRPTLKTTACGLALTLLATPVALAQTSPAPADVRAGTYVSDPGHTKITWSVSHFGFSTYVGQFAKVDATLKLDPKAPQSADLQATIDTASVGTLNPALDGHLKGPNFLDVAKFPKATFKSTAVKVTGERTAEVTGDLTLHGVTKPVTLQVTFIQGGLNPLDKTYSLGFQAKTTIKRSEWGVKAYSPAVGEEVMLQIDTEMKAAT